MAVFFAATAALIMWCAGTVRWPWGWAYLALVGALQTITASALARRDPDLLAERSQLQSGTKNWDKFLASAVALIGPLAMMVVAALDYRWSWSPPMPLWLHSAAIAAALTGGFIVTWAMLSNHFFASTVRIQTERGHRVCDTGPYRFVRHPGYTGMIVFTLAAPFVFGSRWAIPIAAAIVVLLIVRTTLEDRTLAAELHGYAEYRTRVRSRLIPNVW